MSIYFGSPHIKTLIKLQELAQKHDCTISFGVNVINDTDECDWDILAKQYNMSDSVREDLEDNLEITKSETTGYHYWFELRDHRDKDKTIYNTLVYTDLNIYVSYDYINTDNLSDESREWLEDNNDYEGYLGGYYDDTTIKGFKGVDTSDIGVYREGIALKYFGDLVCDYLGEERIVEVY